jgi:hypothetical protein
MTKIYKELVVVLATSVLSLESGIQAIPAAAATLTTDTTTFFNSNPIVSTTRFDSYIPGTTFPGSSVTIDSVTYTNLQASSWQIGVVGRPPNFDFALIPESSNELPDVLSFGSNQSVKAIGLSLPLISPLIRLPPNIPFPEFNFIVEEIEGTLTTFSSRLENGFEGFFGFSSEVGIKTLTVFQQLGQEVRRNWAYGDVYRSAVTQSVGSCSAFK